MVIHYVPAFLLCRFVFLYYSFLPDENATLGANKDFFVYLPSSLLVTCPAHLYFRVATLSIMSVFSLINYKYFTFLHLLVSDDDFDDSHGVNLYGYKVKGECENVKVNINVSVNWICSVALSNTSFDRNAEGVRLCHLYCWLNFIYCAIDNR